MMEKENKVKIISKKESEENNSYSKAFKPVRALIADMSPGNLNRLPDESYSIEIFLYSSLTINSHGGNV